MKNTHRKNNKHGLLAGMLAVVMAAMLLVSPMGALAAEDPVGEADAAVSAAVETAKAEFDAAIQAAEADVTEAQTALDTAQTAQESAEAGVTAAETALAESREEKQAADDALAELIASNGEVTEADVLAADAEKTAAEQERDRAWEEYTSALNGKADAEQDVLAAQARLEEADTALAQAKEEAHAVEEDAQAEDAHIRELEAERADIEQGMTGDSDFHQAQEAQRQAEEAAELARQELAESETGVQNAQTALEEARTAQTAVENELAVKQAAAEAAQADLDAANAAKEAAEQAVREAEAAVAESDASYQAAKEATEQKAAEQTAAEQAVADAQSALTAAESAVTQAETALADAQQALAEIQDVYDQGSLGFINWMLAKEDLTETQRYDLERAKQVLEKAIEEDFAQWMDGDNTGLPEDRNGKVVVPSDENDAVSLGNMDEAFSVMRRINELRSTDENYSGDLRRNDALTNFYFMAVAQSGADRGAGLMRHSMLQVSSENLAFGYREDPTLGWYNTEKAAFDKIRDDLGLTAGTMTQQDIKAIETEARNRGITIGHYTNLFWAQDQMMGVGYTPYGKRYGNTFCYNASKASNYEGRYAMYTVDDFEALFNEYCDSINIDNLRQAVTDAEGAINDAAATKEEKLAAVQTAQEAAEAVANELAEARAAEMTAQENVAAKQADVQTRQTKVTEAQEVVDAMLTVLDEAKTEVTGAESAVTEAKAVTDTAQSALDAANGARTTAEQKVVDADAVVAEKKTAVERFSDALAQLGDAIDAAKTRAAELWGRLSEMVAEIKVLGQTQRNAEDDLHWQNDRVASNTARALSKQSDYEAGQLALENAEAKATELHQQYNDQNGISARLVAAEQAVTNAEAALDAANTALEDACRTAEDTASARAAAQDKLSRAQALSYEEALTTPITDEDFAYLNEYIQAVLDAQARAAAARAELEAVQQEAAVNAPENAETSPADETQAPETATSVPTEVSENTANEPEPVAEEPEGTDSAPAEESEGLEPAPNSESHVMLYVLLDGNGAAWTQGSDEGLSFRADGDYAKFVTVFVDGAELAAGDYTSAEGSTVVNLAPAFLSKLSAGEHTVAIAFDDGEATGSFSVSTADETEAAAEEPETYSESSSTGRHYSASNRGPKTGDDSPIVLLLALGVASLLGTVILLRIRRVKDR